MSQLHELQRAFAAAIAEGKGLPAVTSMRAGPSWRSLALYRRLIRNNYVQALTMTYPMLRRLIGGRYFKVFARGYMKRYPSTNGDLFLYGRHFSCFLLTLEAPRELVELARLEWACHEISQAAERPALALSWFEGLAVVDPACVRVHLQPTARLLRFSSPVHLVWQTLQSDGCTVAEIGQPSPEEETTILVTRVEGKVRMAALAALDYRLLDAMADGRRVDEVERMAMEMDSQFDFARFIASLMEMNALAGVSVETRV
jgi:hypothetical protein